MGKGDGKTAERKRGMKPKGANGPTHSMKEDTRSSFSFIKSMKALPVEELPEGDWLYEIKHDGYRALGFKDGSAVRPASRNKKAFDYSQLLDALKLLPADRVTLDGKIVALDQKGRSSFQLLQVFKSSGATPVGLLRLWSSLVCCWPVQRDPVRGLAKDQTHELSLHQVA